MMRFLPYWGAALTTIIVFFGCKEKTTPGSDGDTTTASDRGTNATDTGTPSERDTASVPATSQPTDTHEPSDSVSTDFNTAGTESADSDTASDTDALSSDSNITETDADDTLSTDSDGRTDSDVQTDSTGPTDSGSHAEAETDTSSDAGMDSGVETDSDTETASETETETETVSNCETVNITDFGDCETALGFANAGNHCAPVTGCGCEPYCDRFFETEDACLVACFDLTACGGTLGNTCAADQYCDFTTGEACGETGATAVCRIRQQGCEAIYWPVCGCDGNTYSNQCEAGAVGWGFRHEGACTP